MPAATVRTILERRGPLPAAELREALQVSAATLSRMVAADTRVLRLGFGRATVYSLSRPIRDLPARLPVYRVNEAGEAQPDGELWPLDRGGTWVVPRGGRGYRLVGPPPVVVDMSPSGYLGRGFGGQSPELGLPPRLQDWGVDHMLIALARRGEDAPGDLIVGEESMDRFLRSTVTEVGPTAFPRLAEASAQGSAGSSAGGEHPKFLAFVNGGHRLIKFSPGDGSPSDLRWRDLLVSEGIALDVLSEAGFATPEWHIVDVGTRRFLEVARFDRLGARGRRGVLTLGPLDDNLFGGRDSWTDAADRFGEAGMLPPQDVRLLRLLDAFGCAISNGDRHFGNVSFFADGLQERPALRLCPVYDMLPMDAAPRSGVVPPLPEKAPVARAKWLDVWEEACGMATEYWNRLASDKRISAAFRRSAGHRARA